MDIGYFVRKLRSSIEQRDSLVSISRGHCSLLAASMRIKFLGNRRIAGLIAVMEDSLADAIADAKAGAEPDLNKFATVLDANEFHLDKFAEEGEEQQP